jgi:hypothetical protein
VTGCRRGRGEEKRRDERVSVNKGEQRAIGNLKCKHTMSSKKFNFKVSTESFVSELPLE